MLMQVMPHKNYPESQYLQVPGYKSPANHLASPPLSPKASRNSPVSPAKPNVLKKKVPGSPELRVPSQVQRPKPALRKKDEHYKKKKVHWTPSVIDNEGNPPPQPIAHATAANPADTKPSENTTLQKSKMPSSPTAIAIAEGRLVPSSSRMPANISPKSPTAKRDHQIPKVTAHAPAKRPQTPGIYHGKVGRTQQKPPHVMSPDALRPRPQPPQRKAVVPPHVPDAPPRRHQKPPPAPRPARLPTPDLPELGDRPFCACNSPYCNGYHKHHGPGKPVHIKMEDQLEAAMAYMKNARWQ